MVHGSGRGARGGCVIRDLGWGGGGRETRKGQRGQVPRRTHVSCDVSPKRGIHTRAVGLVRRRTSVSRVRGSSGYAL